jgi:hypothetical protein
MYALGLTMLTVKRGVMDKIITPCLLILVSILGAACTEDVPPPSAVIQYDACAGREGTCSGDGCCAYGDDRTYGEEHNVRCTVRPGSRDDRYRLTFEVTTSRSADPAIQGEELEFISSATQPRPVGMCDSFEVREDGNWFEAATCESLDAAPEDGGGCVIEIYLDEDDSIIGRFQCKEIQLPAQDRYFSTVTGGDVGWGSIEIRHCSIRL